MPAFSLLDHGLAAAAAIGAGAVNAIAGGGTLITFPALVGIGAGKVSANVTNTIALSPGYIGGTYAQRSDLRGERDRLRLIAVSAALGGLTGSILLLVSGEALFSKLVPWLILFASALLGTQKYIRQALRIGSGAHHMAPATLQFVSTYLVSIYGGYFGAGLGIMTLAVLGLIYPDPLPKLNALKQALALVCNVTAALVFATSSKVVWSLVMVMAPASMIGGSLGGKFVGRVNPAALRAIVVAFGLGLGVWYLVR